MFKYEIFTDSTSDLTEELRNRHNIQYIPMYVYLGEKEYIADLDWKELSSKQFYDAMRDGVQTHTAQVLAPVIEERFSKVLEEGKDVLYLACSSKLSGSIGVANMVAEELMGKYPGRKVVCVDTLRANLGEGAIVMEVGRLRAEGKSLEEVSAWVDENKLNFHEVATVESLTFLKNAGRVKATAAFLGNIIGLKPMVIADALGNNYALKKVKGRRASLLELINLMKERITNPEDQVIYLEHADCALDCEFVRQHIIDTFNPKEVYVSTIGPIIGSTLGPGSIVVAYRGVKETLKGE